MQKQVQLTLTLEEFSTDSLFRTMIAACCNVAVTQLSGFSIIKKSIDARQKQIWINVNVLAYINEMPPQHRFEPYGFKPINQAKQPIIIIGAGPAGLFAALECLLQGIKPIIIERGKNVQERRRDLAALNKEGIVNNNSNYCFGEGGAGTYSDGKLYTRSTKRGDVKKILELFVQYGAHENILYEAHPHIGTNKLPQIISAIRTAIIEYGGEIYFNEKLVDIVVEDNLIKEAITATGKSFTGKAFILATGHSAKDIFELLQHKKILIEAKPFALGVRVEHPQHIIDEAQYKRAARGIYLPPAAYSWVKQVGGNGVFSFCMCPGGIIAPASTEAGKLVVNGWSPSKRNNPYANSGIVVTVQEQHWQPFIKQYGALAALQFQGQIEQQAYDAGGGKFVAPADRLVDFCTNKISSTLPDCSYILGIMATDLKKVLPAFITQSLQLAFKEVGKTMKGYYTNEAVVVATESRTSSPVRIPRNKETMQHVQITNLYPCAEGAGYAGGIISAAIDGVNITNHIKSFYYS
jgi:uncharacterized protein